MKRIKKRLMTMMFSSIVLMLCMFGCKSNPTGPQVTPNVQLSEDYATCTEVWLKIGFTDSPGGGDYRITRDGTTVLTGTISGTSAVVYDTTAQANRIYSYTAYRLVGGQVKQISPALSVTTLDSTSDDFTWRTFNFGGNAGSSLLRDVSIVNDSDIWAAGVVGLLDSTGKPDDMPYSVLHWNGSVWNMMKLKYLPPGWIGDSIAGSGTAVFAYDASNIWLVSDYVNHFDGSQWTPFYNTGAEAANRIWGDFGKDLWFVGRNGTATAYTQGTWHALGNSSSFDIQDVWGISNSNGSDQVVAVACNRFTNNGSAILELSTDKASPLQTAGLPSNISSIWSASGKEWYVCGDGVHRTRSLAIPWQNISIIPPIYSEAIRGNGPNDIFVVGDFGMVCHFNGSTWYTFESQSVIYYAVAIKGNLVVAVGQVVTGGIGGAATILMGRR
jgi:hypothetical protein